MLQKVTNEQLLEYIIKNQELILENKSDIKKIWEKVDEMNDHLENSLDMISSHEDRILVLEDKMESL